MKSIRSLLSGKPQFNRRQSPVDDEGAASFAQVPGDASDNRGTDGKISSDGDDSTDIASLLRALNHVFDSMTGEAAGIFNYGEQRQPGSPTFRMTDPPGSGRVP
jgi:hypothetical protein